MKKNKIFALLMCLIVVFAFTACGEKSMADENKTEIDAAQAADESNENYGDLSKEAKEYRDSEGYENNGTAVAGVGDTVKSDFFDWTVNSVKTKIKVGGQSAGEGKKFVIINITLKNTEDYEYESGNYEFRGVVDPADTEGMDTMNAFYDGMIADEFNFASGETVTGDIVFEVDKDCETMLVNYEEFYGDGSIGNIYWFELNL